MSSIKFLDTAGAFVLIKNNISKVRLAHMLTIFRYIKITLWTYPALDSSNTLATSDPSQLWVHWRGDHPRDPRRVPNEQYNVLLTKVKLPFLRLGHQVVCCFVRISMPVVILFMKMYMVRIEKGNVIINALSWAGPNQIRKLTFVHHSAGHKIGYHCL